MARPRPEKNLSPATQPTEHRLLPMQLRIGGRLGSPAKFLTLAGLALDIVGLLVIGIEEARDETPRASKAK